MDSKKQIKSEKNTPRSLFENVDGLFYITHAVPQANEELSAAVARSEYRHFPADFFGTSPGVLFKMPYVPPYGSFTLCRLQDRIREETGLNAIFQGVVALEISEWIGHEQDEFFTVLLAFLADHKQYWRYLFLAGEQPQATLDKARRVIACYLKTKCYELPLFRDQAGVEGYLLQLFNNLDLHTDRKALRPLAALFLREPNLRDPVLMESIARDISRLAAPGNVMDEALLKAYTSDKTSLLYCLLGDKCLLSAPMFEIGKET